MAADNAELVELLRAALAPTELEPPAEGLLALQRAVADLKGAGGRQRPVWWRRPWAVGAATVVTVLGGSSAAFAAGAPMPTPVRALAHYIGLPVTAPDVYALHNYESQLARTLQHPNPDPKATAEAARQVSEQLRRLSPDDRRAQGAEPAQLLDRAQQVLAGRHESDHPAAGSTTTSSTVAGDDRGRGGGQGHETTTSTTRAPAGETTTTPAGNGSNGQQGDHQPSPSGTSPDHGRGNGSGQGSSGSGGATQPASETTTTTTTVNRADTQNRRPPWSHQRWFNPSARGRTRVSLGQLCPAAVQQA